MAYRMGKLIAILTDNQHNARIILVGFPVWLLATSNLAMYTCVVYDSEYIHGP